MAAIPIVKPTYEEVKKGLARFSELEGATTGLPDMKLPEFQRTFLNVLGFSQGEEAAPGVSSSPFGDEAVAKITHMKAGFGVSFISAKPGKGVMMHNHDSIECFLILKGKWKIEVELGPVDKFEPDFHGTEMEHTEKAVGCLVVARGDGAVGLEMADIAFDAAALAVEPLVPADGAEAVRLRRNDGADAARLEIGANGIGVVSLVAEKVCRRGGWQFAQRVVGLAVRRLAGREVEGERPAVCIADHVNFTGEPAPRAAKRLFASPPFAPAACGWPRTMVLSIIWRSLSARFSASVVATASQRPALHQRRKHRHTLFQLPYRSGRSRHGAPVRNRHRMPLIVARRSIGGRPRPPSAGNNNLRTCHSLSVRSPRPKTAPFRICSLESKVESRVNNRFVHRT
jgi:hypothetical protein